MKIEMIKITIFMIFFMFTQTSFADDANYISNSKCKKDYLVDTFNSSCYEWLGKKNSYELIRTKEFRKFMQEGNCCQTLTIGVYDTLFSSNSFIINSSTKIDSLFHATIIEINNLSINAKDKLSVSDFKNCSTITIPKSLFSLFDKTEQDSLTSIVTKTKTLNVTDSLLEVYEGNHRYEEFPPIDIIACSIRASIEQEPNGEYTLSLNNTRYRMVKLSDNHYVLMKD